MIFRHRTDHPWAENTDLNQYFFIILNYTTKHSKNKKFTKMNYPATSCHRQISPSAEPVRLGWSWRGLYHN